MWPRVKQDHHHHYVFSTVVHRNAPPFGVQNPPKDREVTHLQWCITVAIELQRVNPERADPPSSSKQPCLTGMLIIETSHQQESTAARWATSNHSGWYDAASDQTGTRGRRRASCQPAIFLCAWIIKVFLVGLLRDSSHIRSKQDTTIRQQRSTRGYVGRWTAVPARTGKAGRQALASGPDLFPTSHTMVAYVDENTTLVRYCVEHHFALEEHNRKRRTHHERAGCRVQGAGRSASFLIGRTWPPHPRFRPRGRSK